MSATAWSSDFSYSYFIRLLEAARDQFRPYRLGDAGEALAQPGGGRRIFVRHDVDVDVPRALRMAEIETRQGVAATYYIMTASPMYRVQEHTSQIREIAALGHEVGLHFDCPAEYRAAEGRLEELHKSIDADCRVLEDAARLPVRSLSFHRPVASLLRGPLLVRGRVNAYAAPLMEWYLSDSRGIWRAGEPLPQLLQNQGSILQLLIHPIWWGEGHREPEDRLDDFFLEAARRLTTAEAGDWDARLMATLPAVKRRGAAAEKVRR